MSEQGIAERLRFYAEYGMTLLQKGGAAELAREAADELDRLRLLLEETQKLHLSETAIRERQAFEAGRVAIHDGDRWHFDGAGFLEAKLTMGEAFSAYLAQWKDQ